MVRGGWLTSSASPIMVPQIGAARRLPIQHMEPPSGIRNLPLLVQNPTSLRDRVHNAPTRRGSNGRAGAHARNCSPGVVLPRKSLVIGIGVAKVVVCHDVGCLAPGPGGLEAAREVVDAVDVGVVVAALEVAADLRPAVRGGAVEVDVGVASAGAVGG